MFRHLGAAIATAVAAVAMIAVPGAAARPSYRPAIFVQVIHSHLDPGARASFRYRTTHAAKAAQVLLQERRPGSHSWHTVATGAAGTHAISSPKLATMGSYRFRIVLSVHGRAVARTGALNAYVYGGVSLKRVCPTMFGSDVVQCVHGSDGIGGRTFGYEMSTFVSRPSSHDTMDIITGDTSCRSMTLRYLAPDIRHGKTRLTVRERGGKDQTRTTASSAIGQFHFVLNGAPFTVSVQVDSRDAATMDFNGHASCWSSSGNAF